jgi:O-succinylbenzoic acid--CoA ligase
MTSNPIRHSVGPVNSLRPVSGDALGIVSLLREWLTPEAEPDPIVVETSGSTAAPKRVRLSRRALLAATEATHSRLGGPGEWLLALPPTYVAGVQVIVRSLLAGYEPRIADGDFVGAAAAMIAERRYVSLVPTQLHRFLGDEDHVVELRRFDAVLLGGARIDPSLRAAAEAQGIRLVATYGMAETAGGCVYDGHPLDGVAVKLDADGRIFLAGPMLFDGYDDEALTREVLRGGWFATSDRGRLDEDGRLQVLGRIDDVIVSGGVKIPAQAVAAMLAAHAGVREVEVVGAPDDEWGERVVAVVVGTVRDLETLRDLVEPRTWAPKQIVVVDALPLLPNGKVDRLALKELAADA